MNRVPRVGVICQKAQSSSFYLFQSIFPLLDKVMTIIYTFEIGPLPDRRSRSCKFRSLVFRVVSTDRDIGHWLRVHVEDLLEPLGQSACSPRVVPGGLGDYQYPV